MYSTVAFPKPLQIRDAMDNEDWLSQLRRGVVELCIMQILTQKPGYGYEIVSNLQQFGPLAAGENTIYPVLRRLKKEGHLDTFLQPSPTGPPRQYYQLTPVGEKRLAHLSKQWTEMAKAVEQCMRKGVSP